MLSQNQDVTTGETDFNCEYIFTQIEKINHCLDNRVKQNSPSLFSESNQLCLL